MSSGFKIQVEPGEFDQDTQPETLGKGSGRKPRPKSEVADLVGKRRTGRPGRPASKVSLRGPILLSLTMVGKMWEKSEKRQGVEEDDNCGTVLLDIAPDLAEQLNLLAQQDDRFYDALLKGVSGAGWFGVITTVAPLAIKATKHHLVPKMRKPEIESENFEPTPQSAFTGNGAGESPANPLE